MGNVATAGSVAVAGSAATVGSAGVVGSAGTIGSAGTRTLVSESANHTAICPRPRLAQA